MAHNRHVLSLPTSNLNRLEVYVPAKANGGRTLPMRGPPQQPPHFLKPVPVPVNRDSFGEASLKKKGGKAVHPEEKLMMGKGQKSLH